MFKPRDFFELFVSRGVHLFWKSVRRVPESNGTTFASKADCVGEYEEVHGVKSQGSPTKTVELVQGVGYLGLV